MLDKDYAIQLAMEYGFTGSFDAEGNLTYDSEFVEAMLEAIQYEREACAKLVEPDEEHRRDAEWGYLGGREGVLLLDEVAKEIRARGNKA